VTVRRPSHAVLRFVADRTGTNVFHRVDHVLLRGWSIDDEIVDALVQLRSAHRISLDSTAISHENLRRLRLALPDAQIVHAPPVVLTTAPTCPTAPVGLLACASNLPLPPSTRLDGVPALDSAP
jgi:hypothetical protein